MRTTLQLTMQADSVDQQSVLRWLTGTKRIAIHDEWLKACVEWILSEERVDSEDYLKELVYEQWLHANLKDVVPHGCIPDCVARQQKGQIRGRFIVQVQSIVDVSRPAYGQLQKLKGKSLDEAEPQEKKYSEPKANRLLLLELTDGVTDLQAMEYQPLTRLNVQQLLPGAKLVIEGEIQCRLGMLLLNEGQVQVLGGKVEQLVEANAPRKVLARLLNDESLAGDEPGGGVPSEPGQDSAPAVVSDNSASTSHGGPHSSTAGPARTHNVRDNTARSGVERTTATATSNRQISSQRSSREVVGDDVSELVGGEVDLDNFEDFDDNLCDDGMETEGEGSRIDVPGREEWPQDDSQDDFELQQHDVVKERDIHFSTMKKNSACSSRTNNRASTSKAADLDISASRSHSRMESGPPKSKLNLRQQKNNKTRVCELEQGGERRESQRARNPPVASVKPIQQRLPQERVVASSSSIMLTESELYEEAVVLRNISEVKNNSWKLQPFIKIKAHFVRVCEKLDHTSGVWKVTVMIRDDRGSELRVHLGDKVLERLIGFSAQEFKDHINPRKDIPKVRARAAKGFAYCSSALQDLINFYMVITRKTDLDYLCVIQLLDH